VREIRVLLVGLPTLLKEILEEAIEHARIDVVSAASSDLEAVEALIEVEGATVVLFGLDPDELRDVAGRLYKKFPDVAMFTLSGDGRFLHGLERGSVLAHYGEIPMEQLVRLIRESVAGRGMAH